MKDANAISARSGGSLRGFYAPAVVRASDPLQVLSIAG